MESIVEELKRMITSKPEKVGRSTKYASEEERRQAIREYRKAYYQRKKQEKIDFQKKMLEFLNTVEVKNNFGFNYIEEPPKNPKAKPKRVRKQVVSSDDKSSSDD